MNAELTELLSLRTAVLYGAALVMVFAVSISRVMRERGIQHRAGLPLTTWGEGMADAVYGSMAALAWLLLQDSLAPLPIKAAIGIAMFFGSIGPSSWDFVYALLRGKFQIVKKEDS